MATIFRQKDNKFKDLLNSIRVGELTEEHIEMLGGRVGAKLDLSDGMRPTKLMPRTLMVDEENNTDVPEKKHSSLLLVCVFF